MSKFKISTHRRDLDMAWVRFSILTAPWGNWMTEFQLNEAIENSLCFGVYLNEPKRVPPLQIAFARVVTDHAAFSSVMDVFVHPDFRRQGVGMILMNAIVSHPWVEDTLCILDTRDADGFYEKSGFARQRAVMKRDPS